MELILIGLSVGATIAFLVYGLWRTFGRKREILEDRVQTYANIEEEAAIATSKELNPDGGISGVINLLLGLSYKKKMEEDLLQADIPMRPSEYILMRLVAAGVGVILSLVVLTELRNPSMLAIRTVGLALVGFFVPAIVVKYKQRKRHNKFVVQLADALQLLTNSLRSGYAFVKGLELVAQETSDPISKELGRMLREVSLGTTLEQAMLNLGRRMKSEDLDIVISAFLVQKDVGGNLTEIMEKVAETIRERLKIQGEIRVLTAQGRLSGLVVGLMPVFLFLYFMFNTRDYFDPMFRPPLVEIIPGMPIPVGVVMLLGGLMWQIIGGILIYKIVNIKV